MQLRNDGFIYVSDGKSTDAVPLNMVSSECREALLKAINEKNKKK